MYKEIQFAVVDVDGTLTDGLYQISDDNVVTKSFHTRDFHGLELLMRVGMHVVIMTQSHDTVIKEQIKRICSHSDFWRDRAVRGFLLIKTEVDEKKHEIEKFFRTGKWGWDNIAFIGDAENDLDCIELAAFSACPTDAIPEVREKALYPSDYYGGKGAVHDICKYILAMRDKESQDENS